KVETSGGRLTFENINGKIYGRSSGGSISARLRSPVPGDVNLETSAGSIDVMVPPDAGLDVEAEASSGRVTSELPFVGIRTDRESMKGKINGGGKSLVLRSGAGSISIKPAGAEVAVSGWRQYCHPHRDRFEPAADFRGVSELRRLETRQHRFRKHRGLAAGIIQLERAPRSRARAGSRRSRHREFFPSHRADAAT